MKPLKTLPKPPSPSFCARPKSAVAAWSSSYSKARSWPWPRSSYNDEMLCCDCEEPPDLLTGRTAPESSERLVLTADPDAVVVVTVVAAPDAGADPPLLAFRLNKPKQLISPRPAQTGWNCKAAAERSAAPGDRCGDAPS